MCVDVDGQASGILTPSASGVCVVESARRTETETVSTSMTYHDHVLAGLESECSCVHDPECAKVSVSENESG